LENHDGPVHQRHQDDARHVPARPAGYLLRRAPDHQGAAQDDRERDQSRSVERTSTASGETKKQIERLDNVFKKLGKEPSGTDCPAIDGLIKEAEETASEIADKAVLDAAIIANAQAIEHYEIARYGTLIAWAEQLARDDVVRFLTTNLNEEKAANTKLNTVALRKGVNTKATAA
jgi:ferritin-like metal-binding protein YciE